MRRSIQIFAITALLTLLRAAPAGADFGLKDLDVTFTNQDGSPAMQAGSHPFAMKTSLATNTREEGGIEVIDGALRNLEIFQPAGFAGNPTAVPRCEKADFLDEKCANSTAVGTILVTLAGGLGIPATSGPLPIYDLPPGPGTAAKLGFIVSDVPITIELGVNPDPPYDVTARLLNTSQVLEFLSSETTIWGNPADAAHDALRGACTLSEADDSCPANIPSRPFLTMPRSCNGPLLTLFQATSWWSGEPLNPSPGTAFEGGAETHDDSEPPNPLGTTGCDKLGFDAQITAQPTTKAASSPTGLDFSLDIKDEGLNNPEGIAGADIEKAVVTLPEGFSTNPSIAEGLEVCSLAQLKAETASSPPGAGCPNASKIGDVEVETPLLEGELLKGSLFVAKPYENEFHSLLALYIVIKDPKLGIVVKQAAKVTPDPVTGQLVTTTEDMPQLPFSHFRLHFREGTRSPLASPPGCGTYNAGAELTPSSGGAPIAANSASRSSPDPTPAPAPPLPRRPSTRVSSPARSTPAAASTRRSTSTSIVLTQNRRSPTSRSSCRRAWLASWQGSPSAPIRRSQRPRHASVPTEGRKSWKDLRALPPVKLAIPWLAPASAHPWPMPRARSTWQAPTTAAH